MLECGVRRNLFSRTPCVARERQWQNMHPPRLGCTEVQEMMVDEKDRREAHLHEITYAASVKQKDLKGLLRVSGK